LGSDTNLWEIHKRTDPRFFGNTDSMDINKYIEKRRLMTDGNYDRHLVIASEGRSRLVFNVKVIMLHKFHDR
jgi:hypothetical protein